MQYILKQDMYYHFLTLHVAVTILTRSNFCQEEFINYAENLLHHFVISFEILYGKEYVSHNVHNLVHLCSDVRTFDPLDNFSAFRFENYMTFIKKILRKHEKPLQQLMRRYSEIDNVDCFLSENNCNEEYICKYSHNNGPNGDHNIQSQYLTVSTKNITISCKGSNNNCCILRTGEYILVLNIIQDESKNLFLIGKKLKYVKDVYAVPCKSSDLGIKVMTVNNDKIFAWPITNLQCKSWKIPCGNDPNEFAIFPLNHEI